MVEYLQTMLLCKIFPSTSNTYQYLLVITCDQTNFTIVIPLRSRDVQSVAKACLDHQDKLYAMKQQNLHHIVQAIFTCLIAN